MNDKPELHEVLRTRFHFEGFKPGQRSVIEALLSGANAAAVFPTGGGKSLCYQLPALVLDGLTLVVSPLLALMKDQVDRLKELGIPAARLDSSLSLEEYREVFQQARAGQLKLLYVAPERFNNERFRQSLEGLPIALFAVDEAHCVSEWGHNFRPDYLKLATYASACGAERVLALTATATPAVLADIEKTFSITHSLRNPFHRPNLRLHAHTVVSEEDRFEGLCRELSAQTPGSAIVYVTLQRTAMELAELLQQRGFPALPYHAGLNSELRQETQERFLESEQCTIVATIAFGMGIDKPDIRGVYHFNPPKSLENYSQEIGRAGRDGLPSDCHLFYFPPDRIPLENFVYGDTPTLPALRGLVQELFSGEPLLVLALQELSQRLDIRPLVLRTVLTYLELEGYLQTVTPIYTSYRFKPKLSSRELLAKFSGAEQRFLAEVLKRSQKKRVWFELDVENTRKELQRSREEVVGILERCAEPGWLEIQATQLRHRYRCLHRPDPEQWQGLAEELHGQALERETRELERLKQVSEMFTGSLCLARQLAAHFGEQLASDCGDCSVCRGQIQPSPESHPEAKPILPELPEGLNEPRAAARFLCGIRSPALSKAKLTRHPSFGALSHLSFGPVLEALEQQTVGL